MSDDLDPRWEWIEIGDFAKRDPSYIRGRCKHTELVPVESSVTGEEVAQLCLTCDGQLPPSGYKPPIEIIPVPPKSITRRRSA